MIGWCQVVRLQSTLAITTFDTTEVGTRKNEEPKKLFIACVYIGEFLHLIYRLLEERKKIILSLFEPLSLSLVGQRNSSDAKRWNVIRNSYVKILSINYVVYSSDDGGCLFSELEQCHQIVLTIHHYTITHNDMSANIKTFDSVSISQTVHSIIRSPTQSLKSLYSFRSSLK